MVGALLISLAAAAALPLWFAHRSAAAPVAPSDCHAVPFAGKAFTECIAVPGQHRIAMRITGANGTIYRGFAALQRDIDPSRVAFAMNGGMYDARSVPIGYYAENARRLYPLNTRDGGGNFHLKPNGVFFGGEDGPWRVVTSDVFAAHVSTRPQFGTQSGPMLLIDGKLNAHLSPNGRSLNLRNAVAVDNQGRAHFVISDDSVSFGEIAQFMREHVGATNALYLDGAVSSLWDPATGRMDARYPLGPLIVVTRTHKAGT